MRSQSRESGYGRMSRSGSRSQFTGTSDYWSKSSVRKRKYDQMRVELEKEERENRKAAEKHRQWKMKHRKNNKKKVSDFNSRLELNQRKKELRRKELEKKYYGFDFKPKTQKKKINIYRRRGKTAKVERAQKQSSKGRRPAKRKREQQERPPNQAPSGRVQRGARGTETRQTVEEVRVKKGGETEIRVWEEHVLPDAPGPDVQEQEEEERPSASLRESDSSNEIAMIKAYLQSGGDQTKFKRFSKKKRVVKRSKQSSLDELGSRDDASKLIDMEDEDDIPDQLEHVKFGRGYNF